MKVSSKTDYALRTVLELARVPPNEVVQATTIAKRRNIPGKFLEQILGILKNGGIVGSRRGAKGGYYLSRTPAEVSLFDVVSLMDHGLCRESGRRVRHAENGQDPFAEVWDDIDVCITRTLTGLSLQDMLDRRQALDDEREGNYVI